jgi:peptide/nickel transport system ATP-binding protein
MMSYDSVSEPSPDPLADAPLPAIPNRGGPAQPLVIANGLRKWFRQGGARLARKPLVHAVDGISLQILKGETLGIVGESGCGKSTLARMLAGIITADQGEIILDGETLELRRGPLKGEARRAVQMVFQDSYSSLNPRMTIADTIAFGPRAQGVANGAAGRYARDLLNAVGLDPARFAERYPVELSGGQRQRVNIARALAMRPRLLLLDEPVSALDKSVEAQVLNLLVELRESLGLTYAFISHDLNVVRYVSDRVVVMYLGQIIEEASAAALFSAPRHPYTQALFASRLSPDPSRRLLQPPIPGDPPDPVNPPSGCRFRTRCTYAEAVCASQPPELASAVGLPEDHRVACWMMVPGCGHTRAQGALSI